MKFEAKKKALSSGMSIVQTLTSALAVTAADAVEQVHIHAEGKKLRLSTVAGTQFVTAVVTEVVIEEEGAAIVEMGALTSALAVSGDTFKVVKDGDVLNFACGRAKGRLQAQDLPDEEVFEGPEATISISNLRGLLRSVALKAPSGKTTDRTLHFNGETGTVSAETTDSYRAITASLKLAKPEDVKESASLSLPHKAIDAVAGLLTSDALVGYDSNFFHVKAPGFSVCMPLASTEVLTLASNIGDFLASQELHAEYEILVSEMKAALSDAVSLASKQDGGRVGIDFGAKGGKFTGEGDHGEVEVDFEMKGTVAGPIKALVVPSFLRECLDFYRPTDTVKCGVRTQALVLDIASTDETGLSTQTTVIPLLTEVKVEKKGLPKKTKPAEEKAAEEPKPQKPAAAKPKKTPAPPPPEEEKAEEAEEEKEEPPPPPPPASSKKKPAPPPPPPAAEEDEADVEEDDEEQFDEEESE